MKKLSLTLSAVLCGSVALPSSALAQAVDEIIVTATQRASNIQDIPIAVTAITPAELEKAGVSDLTDLGNVSASFNIQSSQTETQGTSIRIRGVGTTGNNIGLESAVGVFIDGVYQSRPGIALGELVDVEAIEVLRGPQGTLFGRNTTAGAVTVRTKKPNMSETEGFANFSYGNYNLINVQGGISMPVVEDVLAVRLTGSYRNREGFLTSSLLPSDESLDKNRFVIRGQALYEPNDAMSLRVIADYQEADELCCAAVTLTQSPLAPPGFFPALGFEDSVEAQIFNSQEFTNFSDQTSLSAQLDYAFDFADMTAIVGYTDFTGGSAQDEFNPALVYSAGGITAGPGQPPVTDDIQTLTAELRFQGDAMDGRLDWLVGAYYADETIEEVFSLTLGRDFSSVVSQANFGNPGILDLVSAGGAFFASGGNPAAFAPISTNGAFSVNDFSQDAESFSIFTHNIFSVTDTFDVTVGLRYVDDSKNGVFVQRDANNPACLAGLALAGALGADPAGAAAALGQFGPVVQGTLTNPAVVNGGVFLNCFPFAAPALGVSFLPAEFDQDFNDEELIYTIQGSWKATPDVLVYGGFSHGYKAGGFNLDATAAASGNSPSFDSEIIDAYELGIKSTLFDGRVRANLALFLSELTDFQVLEFTGTQFQTFNVDDVTSEGVELEIFADLTDTFSVDGAVTYTDASYGDDCDRGGAIPQATGLCSNSAATPLNGALTNAPKWVAVGGLTYDGKLGDTDWGLLANINARYESDRRTSTRGRLADGSANPFDVQEAHVKINARVGFTMPDENITLEFWGLNLTDEITRGITFNTPLLGASRSAFIQEPRTYGATLRTKF